jgi:hypothetical protein
VTEDEFAGLVGDQIAHGTYAENMPSIMTRGLMPPSTLAEEAGVDPASLILRTAPPRFSLGGHPVRLNDQRQLWKGRNQDFLDGHSMESWSMQLDRRIFFLPYGNRARQSAFFATLGPDAKALVLDSRALFRAFAPGIWLSPINSGNADRRPARRGDWLYVSVEGSLADFRQNRWSRGLVAGLDKVAEISIREPIRPELLRQLSA